LSGVALRLALLGARDPLGEAVIAQIEERDIVLGELIPLAHDDTDDLVGYAGEEIALEPVDGFDWGRADVLIVAGRGTVLRRHVEMAANRGLGVIGLEADADVVEGRVERVADGLAVAAARVLAVIKRQAGLVAVDVFAALPVSMAGKDAVEELARQTQAVFAMEDAEAEVFPVRVAFNLIPQVGAPSPEGDTSLERRCVQDVRDRLAMPELPVMVTASWVPTFYGAALSVHGATIEPMTRAGLRAALANVEGLTLMDESIPGGAPTPYTEAQENESVFVGRVRVDATIGRHFAVWLVCDPARLEAAQIVDRLENMIEKKAK
jgi:aspartate-semialdehyde dehydrogenase